jgi:hypothetical protein
MYEVLRNVNSGMGVAQSDHGCAVAYGHTKIIADDGRRHLDSTGLRVRMHDCGAAVKDAATAVCLTESRKHSNQDDSNRAILFIEEHPPASL